MNKKRMLKSLEVIDDDTTILVMDKKTLKTYIIETPANPKENIDEWLGALVLNIKETE